MRYKNAVSGQVSMRMTTRDAKACFLRLSRRLNKSTEPMVYKESGSSSFKIGAWYLDYDAPTGGYRVHEIYNKHGAVETPLGSIRRNSSQFCELVWAIEALIDSGAVKVSR